MGLMRDAGFGARGQLGRGGDLLAQIGRGVEQHPGAPSLLTASEDCVRGRKPGLPRRTSAQLRQLQLICGKPPPAAEPSTLISIGAAGSDPSPPGLDYPLSRLSRGTEAKG